MKFLSGLWSVICPEPEPVPAPKGLVHYVPAREVQIFVDGVEIDPYGPRYRPPATITFTMTKKDPES